MLVQSPTFFPSHWIWGPTSMGRRGWDSNSSSWWWKEKGAEALEQRRELPAAYLSSPSFPQYHLSYHCWVWGRCEVQIWGSVGGGPEDRKLLPAAGQDNRAKFWLYLLVCAVGEVERGCWKIRITENPQYMLREVIFQLPRRHCHRTGSSKARGVAECRVVAYYV